MSTEIIDARHHLATCAVDGPPREGVAGRGCSPGALDLGTMALDLRPTEDCLEVQVDRGLEEMAHLLNVVRHGEAAAQLERLAGSIQQRVPHLGGVDLAPGAERLDRRLPTLPSAELAADQRCPAGHHRTRGRQQFMDELREGALGEGHHRGRASIPFDDSHTVVRRDPAKGRGVVRAERERGCTAEIGSHEMPVAGDERGQSGAMKLRERVGLKGPRDRLDPRQSRTNGICRHFLLLRVIRPYQQQCSVRSMMLSCPWQEHSLHGEILTDLAQRLRKTRLDSRRTGCGNIHCHADCHTSALWLIVLLCNMTVFH